MQILFFFNFSLLKARVIFLLENALPLEPSLSVSLLKAKSWRW